MTKSGKKTPVERHSSPDNARPLLDTLLLAAVSLLLVWRLLSPTEGASLGYGLWTAQLSYAALVLWSVGLWRRKTSQFQFHRIDVAVAFFIAGHLISGCLALTGDADQRATINMLAEWGGLGATYFLMRQTLTTWDIRRQIVVIMLATTTALAGLGLWQHYVWYPQTAAEYKKIREELDQLQQLPATGSNLAAAERLERRLLDLGVPQTSLEGRGRLGYEARLLSSTEPLGQFALANTLAGLLTVWLIVLAGAMAQQLLSASQQSTSAAGWICGIIIAILIAWCLLLTKSRTAYVGTIAGGLAIILSMIARRSALPRYTWRVAAAVVVVVAGLVTAMAGSGGLDRWVVDEAEKSLRYRLEYWAGTWDVIRTHPVFGIGPGNFRNHYLEFKRPKSSEEISDPHNAFLDTWVNGGLLAVAGMAALAVLCVIAARRTKPAPTIQQPGRIAHERRPAGQILIPIPQASTCGAFIAFCVVGLSDASPVVWALLVSWCATVPLASRAVGQEVMRPVVFLAALLALLVHLLGAGGIGMPAICQTMLLLVTMIVPVAEVDSSDDRSPKIAGMVATFFALGLCIACWQFATGPVSRREAAIAEGDYQLWQRGNPARARDAYLAAAAADPYAGESWRKLAEVEFGRWWSSPRDEPGLLRKATEMLRKSLEKNPRSWTDFRRLGEYLLKAHRRSPAPELIDEAVVAFSRAVELYPNSADLRARYAEALSTAGRPDAARREAALALQLNETTQRAGHVDRVLPEETLESLKMLTDPADASPPRREAD